MTSCPTRQRANQLFSGLLLAGLLALAGRPARPLAHAAPALPVSAPAGRAVDRPARAQALEELPPYFIQNQGQLDPRAAFYLPGHSMTLYFSHAGLTYALSGASAATPASRWVVQQAFVGANPQVPIQGLERSAARFSYFTGERADWITGVPAYAGVKYRELWPGIDLVYRGQGGRLKYEFIVRPGADPGRIRLAYRGAEAVGLNAAGQLEVRTPLGSLTDDAPVAYQEHGGRRAAVAAAYALPASPAAPGAGGELQDQAYTFRLGAYDPSLTLVIDPVVLGYAGFIGGSGSDQGNAIALDHAGNAYVTGYTYSTQASFPATVGPDLTFNGDVDAFVAKVRADGMALLYAGYIGGSGLDEGTAIAVDTAGNAYVTGYTYSTQATFPVTIGPDLTYNGGLDDGFVAKVRADGAALLYAGYIGGNERELGSGIAVDAAGNAFVSGLTNSTQATFPATVGPDLTHNGDFDAFVAKVRADGAALLYAGYIGGSAYDYASGIAQDGAGNAYVTGITTSDQTTFPVMVGPDLTHNGGNDAFVAKVRADGVTLLYAGFIGGSAYDYGRGIAVDGAGNAYVTGDTDSTQVTFPVTVGPDLTFNGGTYDAFVANVQAGGAALLYAGYIGGSESDEGHAIALDAAGNAYVTGRTFSTQATFPVTRGPDLTYNGGYDAFVAKVRAGGAALGYAGFIGGSFDEYGQGIAVDGARNAYVAGTTYSSQATFPATVGPDLTYNGQADAFVAKVQGDVCCYLPIILKGSAP
jgi:hypothetical protein